MVQTIRRELGLRVPKRKPKRRRLQYVPEEELEALIMALYCVS
jgi:hypothetical protein